jgi:hypothetical protein
MRTTGLPLVAALLVAGSVPPAARQPPGTRDVAREVSAVSASVGALERQIALSAQDRFYLLLDPASSELLLMLHGAVLRSFPVAEIEIGLPWLSFGRPSAVPPWREKIWPEGALVPPRPVTERTLTPSPAGDEILPEVPPTAEEAIRAPTRYRVRFAGGLALEVVRQGSGPPRGFVAHLSARGRLAWDDVRSALRPSRDRVRVRVTLSGEDADALYRSLPPEVSLSFEPIA